MSVTPQYAEAIRKLASNKTNRRFLNDSPDHAQLLIDIMVGGSLEGEEVLAYCTVADFCLVQTALKVAQGNIRILLDDTDSPCEGGQSEHSQNRVEIKRTREESGNHFLIAGCAFRCDLKRGDTAMVSNFNEPNDQIQRLVARFEAMWERAIKSSGAL